MTNDVITKKYILKPGFHQFVPGSAAIHCNENLSDEEAEWYLQRYPHIEALFAPRPPEGGGTVQANDERKISEDEVLNKGGFV
ncbi:hypothetical protein DIU31_015645 [Mucilaginibacter rubeus]|uniref:Uncharacterized protein n=1 Tax=Mucilaginibacter rubeus TaxID=2027860 RepID=A0AAE6JG97_9SPHI|nr:MULTISPECIES: hypothetical protein [Mucilaginibacter]QEM04876.1 hypothetical protein DIU31_015645 [Mucilaginibacter rubeus]QEM17470.1 hypothetical protein DIU38_015810 [Mucilaginibacter gossypii]QTE46009.1 hypothetical protein J3L19_11870 [Mucilaginibacter rubeus]QTE52606.1 hypothetical protein J3L21_11840 [Mucilaginibacter rubeus]QTE57695.1 hypothetical protein J3L23_03515 [Mucilaginibacter rubeus]